MLVVHCYEFINGSAIPDKRPQSHRQVIIGKIAVVVAVALKVKAFVTRSRVLKIDGDVEHIVLTIASRCDQVEDIALSVGLNSAEGESNRKKN